jgi:hypothetical protein
LTIKAEDVQQEQPVKVKKEKGKRQAMIETEDNSDESNRDSDGDAEGEVNEKEQAPRGNKCTRVNTGGDSHPGTKKVAKRAKHAWSLFLMMLMGELGFFYPSVRATPASQEEEVLGAFCRLLEDLLTLKGARQEGEP